MLKIRRALISVYSKEGLTEFASGLIRWGVQIISTGNTAKILRNARIAVSEVTEITHFPELLGGRVKTLHPAIHAAILADKKNAGHLEQLRKQHIQPIDLVAVNLYPFEETVDRKAALPEAIEQIDIGGPALLRAAAKNFSSVAVLCHPSQYADLLVEVHKYGGVSPRRLGQLAMKAFEHVAHYDSIIANYFRDRFADPALFPEYLNLTMHKIRDLRYGENHHQRATLYGLPHYREMSIVTARVLKEGKSLSYNNILDGNAAIELIREFDEPTAAVIKHNNPSGVASDPSILEAYKTARAVDPEAAFGGVVVVNRPVDGSLAREILSTFVEVVIAPKYGGEGLRTLEARRNLRVLQVKIPSCRVPYQQYRSVAGGLLAQDADIILFNGPWKIVTRRSPDAEEKAAMSYAWKVVTHVKSNAIVFANAHRVVGIGAGQMKRVDAAKLASMIAKDYSGASSLRECAMASDAFLPFRDGIDFAADLGIRAVIQPGGSIKDDEVIAAANEHGMTMAFTGTRHFRH